MSLARARNGHLHRDIYMVLVCASSNPSDSSHLGESLSLRFTLSFHSFFSQGLCLAFIHFSTRGCASCYSFLIQPNLLTSIMHFTALAVLALGAASFLEAAATPHHHHPFVARQNAGFRNGTRQNQGQRNGGQQNGGQQNGGQQNGGQQNGGQQNGGQQNGGQANCLNANALQLSSTLTGQEDGTEGIKANQARSAT